MLWIGRSSLAAGKSPGSGPGGPAPRDAGEVALLLISTIFFFNNGRIRR